MELSKAERVKRFGEVFTPVKTVRDMCDMLEAESPGCFDPERTFLEPACGDGAFVAEILRRKFDRCKRRRDYIVALESVYGFEIQADNVERCIQNLTILCCQYFRPTKAEMEIINDHIIQCDGLKVMRMLARMGEGESGNLSP
jgi:hypothetical protein